MLFTKKVNAKPHSLQDEIDAILSNMDAEEADTVEYEKLLGQLERLSALKIHDKDRRPSADTILSVAGNLAGIAIIIGYERLHVITSKALTFVIKTKV